ncbi:hypothetical protein SRHO_G00183180 [Serrasalmus rhombeus]
MSFSLASAVPPVRERAGITLGTLFLQAKSSSLSALEFIDVLLDFFQLCPTTHFYTSVATRVFTSFGRVLHPKVTQQAKEYKSIYSMPWMFVDWFVPVYLLVSVLVLVGFGACLYFLEPGLQDAHKWSNKSIKRQPLAPTLQAHRDDDSSALI